MTENSTKSPARLLAEAELIASFKSSDGWPNEFSPAQIAALMAGGQKGVRAADFRTFSRMVEDGLNTGSLACREEQPPPRTIKRRARGVEKFAKATFPIFEHGRQVLYYNDTEEQPKRRHVSRQQLAAWLVTVGEEPSEHVRAWLGNKWHSAADGDAQASPVLDGRLRKRKALIDELHPVWPQIESDLSEASRNGLEAAKSEHHGFWKIDEAIKWATQRGLIIRRKAENYIAANDDSELSAILRATFGI